MADTGTAAARWTADGIIVKAARKTMPHAAHDAKREPTGDGRRATAEHTKKPADPAGDEGGGHAKAHDDLRDTGHDTQPPADAAQPVDVGSDAAQAPQQSSPGFVGMLPMAPGAFGARRGGKGGRSRTSAPGGGERWIGDLADRPKVDAGLMPLVFEMTDELGDRTLIRCDDVEGIQTDTGGRRNPRVINLTGCSVIDPSFESSLREEAKPLAIGGVNLNVLDVYNEALDGVHLENAVIVHVVQAYSDLDRFDISIVATVDGHVDQELRSIWWIWGVGRPTDKNLWVPYSPSGRSSWLRVAGTRNHRQDRNSAPQGLTYELDGAHITDAPGFYCALGEAINGPGGYFGIGPDSLRDGLLGDYGARPPFTLVWPNSDLARARMGTLPDGRDHHQVVLEILAESGVTINGE